MTEPRTAYLSLGSNVGDRLANLREAIRRLDAHTDLSVSRISKVYETEPVGVPDQPWFLNVVVEVLTDLSPDRLLRLAKGVESAVGRKPTYRWGPREIDVDILLYGDERVDTEELTIPHRRMSERLFVLLPLRDLRPDWIDGNGVGIDQLIGEGGDGAQVRHHREGIEEGRVS